MNEHAQFAADDTVVESALTIPQCLSRLANDPRWVLWRYGLPRPDGKRPKQPHQVDGSLAKSNDPSTWVALNTVWDAYAKGRFDGIGLNMLGLQGIVGIDLDGMRDPKTGEPINEAAAAAITYGAYVEISPSGTGYRIFGTSSRTKGSQYKENGAGYEIYGSEDARYLTITGQKVEGTPDALIDITPLIDWLERSAEARKAAVQQAPRNFTVGGVPLPDAAPLPDDILGRIATSSAEGTRSSAFQGVVNACVNRRLRIEQVESAMREHPDGIANKYLVPTDRLTKELKRSWDDATEKGYVSPQKAKPKQAIRWLDFGEVEAKPPVWLVNGFLEQSCMVILFGEPGSAKSFLALDWALCIATGMPWHDREVERGPVVYIAGEGHSGLSRRRDAWFRQRGIANPGRDLPFKLSGHAVDIPDTCDNLLGDLAALSVPPSLIVIDTLNRNFGGGNENDTKDMTAFTHAVDRIRTAFPQAAVVVVHHTGLSEKHRERGSNSLRAASEAAYRMDIAPEKDGAKHFVLVNVRMKDGPAPDPVHLKLEDVRLSGEMGSAVLVPGDAPSQPTGGGRINGTTQAVLAALVEAARSVGVRGEDGRYWVPEPAWRDAFYAAQGDMKTSTKNTNYGRGVKALAKVGKAVAEGNGVRLDHATSLRVATASVINT